jgi:hypothetical protein
MPETSAHSFRRFINTKGSVTPQWYCIPVGCADFPALQRKNAENLKQIFPGKEYRGLSPNFHIHVSVSELYIPTMGLSFLLEEICGPILGIYKSLTDT